MRVVIELKRGEVAGDRAEQPVTRRRRWRRCSASTWWRCIDGQPKLLSACKEMLDAFLRHRREVVTRRTIYDLRKARERAHILEGLAVALANIDEIIALIKASPSPAEAQDRAAGPGVDRRAPCRRCWSAPAPFPRGRTACRRVRHRDGAATGCRKRRPRPFSTCACTASPVSSRTRSSPSSRSCWCAIADLSDILARPGATARR